MIGRFFSALLITLVVWGIVFGVGTAVFPESIEILEPIVCEDGETMEATTRSVGSEGEFTIDVACIGRGGDGRTELGFEVFALMGLLYFLPIFGIVWLLTFFRAVRSDQLADKYRAQTSTVQHTPRGSAQVFHMSTSNVSTSSADPNVISETLALVQEALKDGVITSDEFDRINARVSQTAARSSTTEAGDTLSGRLHDLQNAYSQGLITRDEYDSKRREILDGF